MSSTSDTYHAPNHAELGMIGKILRRDEPRDRRQRSARHVVPELVQHVAVRHADLARRAAVAVRQFRQRSVRRVARVRRERLLRGVLSRAPTARSTPRRCTSCARFRRWTAAAKSQRLPSAVSFARFRREVWRASQRAFLLLNPSRRFGEELWEIRASALGEPDVVLREPFDRVVAEVAEPRVLVRRSGPMSMLISF